MNDNPPEKTDSYRCDQIREKISINRQLLQTSEVNADWVLNQLRELALTACDSVKVSALDKIAKHLGMYDSPAPAHEESQPQVVLYWPENGRD
ncbi:hypothetical protein N9Z53_01495 [Mariniblastus sp.]|nr:hypothetical protein [Mariniblastus sp.]